MKLAQNHLFQFAIAGLIAAAAFTGCSSGAGSSMSPSGSSNGLHRVGPLDPVSTLVGIKNTWTETITGSASAVCWTISPSLPAVGAGMLSDPITLTYSNTCAFISVLPITYGPANGAAATHCTFDVSYNGTHFVYTVDNGALTDCTAVPSADTRYNEILTYVLIPPSARHAHRHG